MENPGTLLLRGTKGEQNTTVYTSPRDIPYFYATPFDAGGAGVVDEVFGNRDGQEVKLARKTIILDRNPIERRKQVKIIANEVDILQKGRHPQHTVKLVEAYVQNDLLYAIVMEPRADGNLETYLVPQDDKERLDQGQVFCWIRCLVSAVQFLHGKILQHRDIKPPNILVHEKTILLTDFGISKEGLKRTVPTTKLGRSSGRTRSYCSPDVDEGHTRGRSADIFSLGAVFLEMLASLAGKEQLQQLRDSLTIRRDNDTPLQTFALRPNQAVEFMNALGKRLTANNLGEQAILLELCRGMLNVQRERRPVVDDISLWLSHKNIFTTLPSCACSSATEIGATGLESSSEQLRTAYRKGHRLMMQLHIEKRGRMAPDDALVAACEGGMLDVVQDLVDHQGACAKIPKAFKSACAAGHESVAGFLLDKEADIDATDEEGWTGLHHAASLADEAHSGQLAVVRLLVKRGANKDIKDKKGNIPLHYAIVKGHEKARSILMGTETLETEE